MKKRIFAAAFVNPCKGNGGRGFAAAAGGEVTDTDDGMGFLFAHI